MPDLIDSLNSIGITQKEFYIAVFSGIITLIFALAHTTIINCASIFCGWLTRILSFRKLKNLACEEVKESWLKDRMEIKISKFEKQHNSAGYSINLRASLENILKFTERSPEGRELLYSFFSRSPAEESVSLDREFESLYKIVSHEESILGLISSISSLRILETRKSDFLYSKAILLENPIDLQSLLTVGLAEIRGSPINNSIKWFLFCVIVSKSSGDESDYPKSLGNLAQALVQIGRDEDAEKFFLKAVSEALSVGHYPSYYTSIVNFTDLKIRYERYLGAEDKLREALVYQISFGELESAAHSSRVIGHLLKKFNRLEEARKNYKRASLMFSICGNEWASAHDLGNQANILFEEKNYEASRKIYEQLLDKFAVLNDVDSVSTSFRQLGFVEKNEKNYGQSIYYFQMSAKSNKERGLWRRYGEDLFNEAQVHILMNDIPRAKKLLSEALSIFTKFNCPNHAKNTEEMLGILR